MKKLVQIRTLHNLNLAETFIYNNNCIIMDISSGGEFIEKYTLFGCVVASIFVIISMTAIPCLAVDEPYSAKNLTYITEQFPPYNYQEGGKLQGISVDLLEKMWKKMSVNLNESNIRLISWTEGYRRTLNESNTVLFSTARLPQREHLFKWVGPIGPIRNVLLAKKDKILNISSAEDLKKYKIGAINDDSAVQMLLDKGMKKQDLVLETASSQIIEMLQNGSIDAWAYGDTAGIWQIQKSGANASDFKVAYVLDQIDYYYAFNKETPESIVQSFQQALDYIKSNKDKDGVTDYEKILAKYIPAML